MNNEANLNRNILASIKAKMLSGEITYEEAKKEAQPTIDLMNKRVKEIADEYGVKPKLLTFVNLMR